MTNSQVKVKEKYIYTICLESEQGFSEDFLEDTITDALKDHVNFEVNTKVVSTDIIKEEFVEIRANIVDKLNALCDQYLIAPGPLEDRLEFLKDIVSWKKAT